jgi:hypothetical protein
MKQLYIYKIWQEVNKNWDTFDSAIVCAENKEEARKTCPCEEELRRELWADKRFVKVEYLGKAKSGLKKGVILASFRSG